VTPESWATDFKVVDRVTEKGAALSTRARFVVEAGEAGAKLA
jgi:alkaline phosphatase D